jgi:molybdopterin-binding protein
MSRENFTNRLTAIVKQIEHVENLHIVTCQLGVQTLKMVSLELNETLQVDRSVDFSVKSTNIALAKNLTGQLSYANQLKAKIVAVENGKLLSSIQLDVEGFSLESLVTLEASLAMSLSVGDEVLVLLNGVRSRFLRVSNI